MELTRRDALVAVASTAGTLTAGAVADRVADAEPDDQRLDRVLTGLDAAAAVVFPSEASADEQFLRTYVLGRYASTDAYLSGCASALRELDRLSTDRFGAAFASLGPGRRETVLVDAGVPDVTPDPDGTALEGVRYYVVNELLFALYSSPTGGELLGNENPPGYPGGREAYQRGPDDV